MRRNWQKQLLAAAVAASMLAGNVMPALAGAAPDGKTDAADMAGNMGNSAQWNRWKNEWETLKNDWTQISLTPGSDASQLNYAWYSVKSEGSESPKLRIGEGRSMKHAKEYTAVQTPAATAKNGTEYLSNKVTVTGLKENTTYYYAYQKEDGTYTEPEEYVTKSSDAFTFIYVGDPQIGSSNGEKAKKPEDIEKDTFVTAQSDAVRSDAFNWETTLNQAMAMSGDQASFVLSAGDQIQTNAKKVKDNTVSEVEYVGYLSPDILKTLPVATTVGNHDADNPNYTYHFNTPNTSELGANDYVGGDYWFTYGSALFLMLNTQDTNTAEHKQFIEAAVKANPQCKWRIVTLHQDIYGSAEHSNEPTITNLRYELVPYFEANDIDVVLTGHDHAYSRSQLLQGGRKTNTYYDGEYTDSDGEQQPREDYYGEQFDKDIDAGDSADILYESPANIRDNTTDMEEKAYLEYLDAIMDQAAVETVKKEGETVVNPDGILYMTANSASGSKYYDLVPRMQTYIAARWQEDVPTYSLVTVTEDTFSISTYRTDNDAKIDETFTIAKGTVDKARLNEQIADAEKNVVPAKADYTADSYTVFEKALQGAKQTAADAKATGSEVEAALKALLNAKAALMKTNTSSAAPAVTAPRKVQIKSLRSKAAKKAVLTVKKTSDKVSGYEIKYAYNKKFKGAKTKLTKKTTYTLKALKSGKTCYVKVRAYKNTSTGKKYGAYSKVRKVKVR